MRQFDGEGYTAKADDIESIAARAWMAATGESFEQYADQWVV